MMMQANGETKSIANVVIDAQPLSSNVNRCQMRFMGVHRGVK